MFELLALGIAGASGVYGHIKSSSPRRWSRWSGPFRSSVVWWGPELRLRSEPVSAPESRSA